MIEIMYILMWIILTIFIIYTLVRQAKNKQWVWFVLTLLLPIVWLIYWIYVWVSGD
jgi:hypothetical protein